jgi:hypothetical protein
MALCFIALLAVSVDPAKPPAPKPIKWPVAEKIVAEFQKGVPQGKAAARNPPHRIWTVRQIKATFGEPDSKAGWKGVPEQWVWTRDDGTAVILFADLGYGGATDPGARRLQIQSATFYPPGHFNGGLKRGHL